MAADGQERGVQWALFTLSRQGKALPGCPSAELEKAKTNGKNFALHIAGSGAVTAWNPAPEDLPVGRWHCWCPHLSGAVDA